MEDILSAIKVGRYCDSLALLGSYLPTTLTELLKTYDTVYIWLDHDKLQTSIKAMRSFTQTTGKVIKVIDTAADPKEIPGAEIERRLYGQESSRMSAMW